MKPFEKATKIQKTSSALSLGALKYGDPRYVSLAKGRDSLELEQMRIHIRDADGKRGDFAKVAFMGHRGCGKTTELRLLEHELSDQFVPLYLRISNHVLRECDHIDILVWLVENLLRRFSIEKWPLNANVVIDITNWFSKKVFDNPEQIKEEIRSETGTDQQSVHGFFWMPILLLNRIKSMMLANTFHREMIRKKLHTYTADMLYHINVLLDDARKTLERVDKSPELLIMIDNLDHMPSDTAAKFFFDSAEVLKALHVHIVFTAPLAVTLPPLHIQDSFEHCFTLRTVKVRDQNRRHYKAGIDELIEIASRRIDTKKFFTSNTVVRHLAIMSGGNFRDLFLLIHNAQLAARALKQDKIDQRCADVAVQRLRFYYDRMLIPHEVYYPLLYSVHRSGRENFLIDQNHTAAGTADSRFFGSELLGIGAVVDHEHEGHRYYLHPAVPDMESFKEFCKKKDKKS
jgi:hypothetical protein